MSAAVRFDGELPPAGGLGWCALCAALYKGFALTSPQLEPKIQAALRSEQAEVMLSMTRTPMPGAPALQEAVCLSLVELPAASGNATVLAPTCWSHLRGLKISSIAVATGAIPMLGGKSG
ncbi:MAG: hypothetical protein ACRDOK_04570 [Streptosporangiaceae bacterium]